MRDKEVIKELNRGRNMIWGLNKVLNKNTTKVWCHMGMRFIRIITIKLCNV